MKRSIIMAAAVAAWAATGWAAAPTTKGAAAAPGDDSGILAVGAKVGTLGGTLEGHLGIVDRLNVRVGENYLRWGFDASVDEVDYDCDLDFLSTLVALDWFPFGNNFKLSGGVIFNQNEITLDGEPSGTIDIGDSTYPAAAVGTLHGKLEFEPVAPYIGLGYGNPMLGGRLTFLFNLGVVYQPYDVTLTADGPISMIPQFRGDLAQEEEDIEDEFNQFQIYPVLDFGIAYRF